LWAQVVVAQKKDHHQLKQGFSLGEVRRLEPLSGLRCLFGRGLQSHAEVINKVAKIYHCPNKKNKAIDKAFDHEWPYDIFFAAMILSLIFLHQPYFPYMERDLLIQIYRLAMLTLNSFSRWHISTTLVFNSIPCLNHLP